MKKPDTNQFKDLKRFIFECTELIVMFIMCLGLAAYFISGSYFIQGSLLMTCFLIVSVGIMLVFLTLQVHNLNKKLGAEIKND